MQNPVCFHAIRIIQEMGSVLLMAKYSVIAVLAGKWQRAFLQTTGLRFRAVLERFADLPKFQCLLLEDGQTPEWFEGVKLMWQALWTLSIGENCTPSKKTYLSSSWRILKEQRAEEILFKPHKLHAHIDPSRKSWLSSGERNRISAIKQGGRYQYYPEERRTRGSAKIRRRGSSEVLDERK